jgi:hypothetical protein
VLGLTRRVHLKPQHSSCEDPCCLTVLCHCAGTPLQPTHYTLCCLPSQGYLSISFDESYIRLAPQRNPSVPPLTPQQLEAIQLINAIANRPDVQLTWSLQPGDLQLLNNHTIFHTRDGWEEHEVGARGLNGRCWGGPQVDLVWARLLHITPHDAVSWSDT